MSCMYNIVFICFTAVLIEGTFKNIRIGNTVNITCKIQPPLLNTSYEWMSWNGEQISSDVLMLTGSDTIDDSMFACSVRSSQLYLPIKKTISVTVKGIINNTSM